MRVSVYIPTPTTGRADGIENFDEELQPARCLNNLSRSPMMIHPGSALNCLHAISSVPPAIIICTTSQTSRVRRRTLSDCNRGSILVSEKNTVSWVSTTITLGLHSLCAIRETSRPLDSENVCELSCSQLSVQRLLRGHGYQCFSRISERWRNYRH